MNPNPSDFTSIYFPSIGLEINPPRGFSIGPFNINFYGLIIAVGLLLAVLYGLKRCREFGYRQDDVIDGILWVVPISIICARIYYCVFQWKEEYAADPISVLYIWNGGLAIYGAVIGAAISIFVFTRVKKLKLLAVLDITAVSFLIGQFIGRWGNFFNREAFGAETTSFFRMGLKNGVTGQYTFYHPTFLYESVWNLIGFVLLHFLSKKRKYDGQIALGYVAWYGLGRTFIEGLRMDSLYWGPFRVSQVLAAVSCFTAVVILLWQSFRPHDPAKMYGNQMAPILAAEDAEKAAKQGKSAPAEETEASETPAEDTAEEAAAPSQEDVGEQDEP